MQGRKSGLAINVCRQIAITVMQLDQALALAAIGEHLRLADRAEIIVIGDHGCKLGHAPKSRSRQLSGKGPECHM